MSPYLRGDVLVWLVPNWALGLQGDSAPVPRPYRSGPCRRMCCTPYHGYHRDTLEQRCSGEHVAGPGRRRGLWDVCR